jgi:hypothetical protein
MENLDVQVSDYFKNNPNAKEVFATADEFLFTKKQDATHHALTLNPDHPDVKTFTNDSLPEEKPLQSEQLVKEYEDLFKEKPDERLSDEEIENLINAELEK